MGAGRSQDSVGERQPPWLAWVPGSAVGEVAEVMERVPFFLFPLGDTMSFKSELACLGCAALAKPAACASGARAVFVGRGRCWLVRKGFLSPKHSLITGVQRVPGKRRGG